MSIGSFFRNIGRGIQRGAQQVGSFVRRAASKVGDFARKVDFGKVADISRKVRDVAQTIGAMGIPVLSTAASVIGKGADIVSRVADKGSKVKEGIQIAQDVGSALEKPSDIGGLVKAGRRAYEFGKGLR